MNGPKGIYTKNIVLVSTVIRNSTNKQLTGFLYKIDWDKGLIEKRVDIPVEQHKPLWNERGGNRGGRGVSVYNNKIYLATATAILVYNFNLDFVNEIRNELFAGLHEIVCTENGIWVTSTVHDLLLKIDYSGNTIFEWWGSESKILQKELNYKPRELNIGLTFKFDFAKSYEKYCEEERLHLNAVAEYNNAIFVLASRRNALIRIKPEPEKIIFKDNGLGAPHNCLFMKPGSVLINDTMNQSLKIYNYLTGVLEKSISTRLSSLTSKSEQFSTGGWQRGLASISDEEYIVGTSPATVFQVNTSTNEISKTIILDNDERHCVHGLFFTRLAIAL